MYINSASPVSFAIEAEEKPTWEEVANLKFVKLPVKLSYWRRCICGTDVKFGYEVRVRYS